ncbi:MAG: Eco57I restriction-modification methylase domain-containing protein [Gallionella sp.]
MHLVLDQVRREASDLLDQPRRAELGQYMTPSSIAEFMAGLFSYKSPAKLLDAGAGVGSLTAAFFEQALHEQISVSSDAWEIDSILVRYLQTTLDEYVQVGRGKITAEIHAADFIEDAIFTIQSGATPYSHAILNPPYKKINSHSSHRKLLRMVGIETVNLYTAFVALAVMLLQESGELVAIIPRSFCNGPYYKPFRHFILSRCAIRHIHLFDVRNQAFQDDAVLQENIILHLVKGELQNTVTVSTSRDGKFTNYQQAIFVAEDIVKSSDNERFIHIPTTLNDTNLPSFCSHTLNQIGLTVSTGPVVDFRLKEYWCDAKTPCSAPLIYPHHYADGKLTWPKLHKKPNALQHANLVSKNLMPNGHYVLVKRFSSKEERRRLVAYHFSSSDISAAQIGFENHWNVFHINKQGLAESLAIGLTTFLNSTVLDNHFRVFSGHTQVNATDLRNMRYPSLEQLQSLGLRAKNRPNDQATIDQLLEELVTR